MASTRPQSSGTVINISRKLTDEANPNIFGYSIKLLGQDFTGGKIEPRKVLFLQFSLPRNNWKSWNKKIRKVVKNRPSNNKSPLKSIMLSSKESNASGTHFPNNKDFIEPRKILTKHFHYKLWRRINKFILLRIQFLN